MRSDPTALEDGQRRPVGGGGLPQTARLVVDPQVEREGVGPTNSGTSTSVTSLFTSVGRRATKSCGVPSPTGALTIVVPKSAVNS